MVWAQFLASRDLGVAGTASVATSMPLAAEQSTAAQAADLAERYKGWHTWFGRWTRQWWAIPKQASATAALIAEPTACALRAGSTPWVRWLHSPGAAQPTVLLSPPC